MTAGASGALFAHHGARPLREQFPLVTHRRSTDVFSMPRTEGKPPASDNIVLIGFMGSGKSSIGRLLARRLRFQLLDTDKLIEERSQMRIAEIFERHGEAYFRDRETAVLESLLGKRRHVFATGGGIVTRPRNIEILRQLGFVVLLKADPEEIFRRVSRNSDRPLLKVENPRERVLTMMAEREPLYREAAQFEVDSTGLRHEEVAARILDEARRVFGWPNPATA
jgi:shikimate kinase